MIRALPVAGALGGFFALKLALGLLLLRASTSLLDSAGFVAFSQLFLWFALLSTISAAGVQHGLARQVAAARGDVSGEMRAISAAVRIWLVASVVLVALSTVLRLPVSELLVDDRSLANALPVVTAGAALGGLGVLACAVLNGRDRAATSLTLQSLGLALGGGLCLWRLSQGDAAGAVLGYAAGPVATSLLAGTAIARAHTKPPGPITGLRDETLVLLRYSATFLGIATVMPATLFALRAVYRDAFGIELLGYWLAANRVSDVTSQILGLYMAQIFLPQAARESDPVRLRRIVVRTLVGGSAVMLGGWAVFMLGAPFFVGIFLSPAFLPANPFIAGYLLGDGLRVAASLTSHWMMARGRPMVALGVEVVTAMVLAILVLGLTRLGRADAPYSGYIATFAGMTLALLIVFGRSFWSSPKPIERS